MTSRWRHIRGLGHYFVLAAGYRSLSPVVEIHRIRISLSTSGIGVYVQSDSILPGIKNIFEQIFEDIHPILLLTVTLELFEP